MKTLDGVQAVAYARIRYTSGGDYKRAKRQRIVLAAMMKKMKSANLAQLNEIVDTVFPEIQTSLSRKDLITMARVMLTYDMSNSRGFPFYRSAVTLGSKGSCVVPCDLETNVSELQKILYGNKDYKPSKTVQEYNDIIINQTGLTADSAAHDDFEKGDNEPDEPEQSEDEDADGEDASDEA
jgi:anionic cell wall polymer biosynthesis LytR-Cps2A-Psr (LCP) family protein